MSDSDKVINQSIIVKEQVDISDLDGIKWEIGVIGLITPKQEKLDDI